VLLALSSWDRRRHKERTTMTDHDDAVEGPARLALVEEEQPLPQPVAHLRESRAKLREDWAGSVTRTC
jgi:hypothetical protein